MRLKNYFQKHHVLGFFLAAALLMLTSCGSYQYASYDDDGIYNDTRSQTNTETIPSRNTTPAQTSGAAANNKYASYFSAKSAQYENIDGPGAIFTEVDDYASINGTTEIDTTVTGLQYHASQPSWGSTHDNVSVNIINTGGFYNPFWGGIGFYDPWYGYGWNSFYGPYNWGWNWGWGPNWGWGFSYNFFPYNRFYGPYYRPFFRSRYGYAFHRGARGAYVGRYNALGRNAYSRGYNRSRSTSRYSGTRSRSNTYSGSRSRSSNYNGRSTRSRTSNYGTRGNSSRSRNYSSGSSRSRSYSPSRSRSSGSRGYSPSRSRSSSGSRSYSRSSSRSSSGRSGGGSRSRSRG
ncbi:hypothetical protein ACFSTE_14970 [Aquimarina hainanensis]|uniref:Vitellogenin II n=1 Tax=Aquimarina hainanensis TaxID=1578017 RepID=A0ABW5NB75_9FLAO|nr:hypothetical protein [Aquimarina sp. TRL1]QKX03530.1 hypothetical protein HN014_00895 [Aquimarina sp. TRL1]